MPLKLTRRRKKSQPLSAGLAIHDDAIYFAELDESGNVTRNARVELESGCVVNGSIKNFDMLQDAFNRLRNETGRIREPVVLGIPSGDTVLRPLNFPRMDLEDIKGTLDLNFDEYFPIPRYEAVFDATSITTPNDTPDRQEVTVLAAASRANIIERLMDIARKAGISAGAVEPVSFAMLRSVPETQSGLSIFADAHSIVTTWQGSGIYFRPANNLKGVQDIMNTVQFIGTQYRNIQIERLILAGLEFQFQSTDTMEILNVQDEYLAAKGLAMRGQALEISGSVLDLRPMEYVELERRRYSFNPTRLAFWCMLVGFVMLSLGTIMFTLSGIRDIALDIESMRENVNLLTQRRMRLTQENSRLEQEKNKTQKVIDFLQSDMPVLEVMSVLEASAGTGVKFDNADFSNGTVGVTVTIDGKASDESSILSLTEGLKESDMFTRVMLPVSQKDMTGRIIFKLILMVKGASS